MRTRQVFLKRKPVQFGFIGLLLAPIALVTPIGIILSLLNIVVMNAAFGSKNPTIHNLSKVTDFGYEHNLQGQIIFWSLYCVPFVVCGVLWGFWKERSLVVK